MSEEKFLLMVVRAEELAVLGSWTKVFREIFAHDGMTSKLTPDELAEFRKSHECAAIQQIIADLRKKPDNQQMAVLTIRLPVCVHESLRLEAHNQHTSMNQLCISKLLQSIDSDLVPSDIPSKHSTGRTNI